MNVFQIHGIAGRGKERGAARGPARTIYNQVLQRDLSLIRRKRNGRCSFKRATHTSQEGFTLIEVILILVILGALAAVAVPKYFDLQARAREKTVQIAFGELETRIHQYVAKQLLIGKTWPSISLASTNIGVDLGYDFEVTEWLIGATQIDVKVKYPAQETSPARYRIYDATFSLPQAKF